MEAQELQDKSVDLLTATIAISTTTSDAVLLYGTTAIGLSTPAALTGTILTFTGSMDGGDTFVTINNEFGSPLAITVAVDSGYTLDANTFAPYDQIKVISDQTEAAERLIKIKPFAI